MYRLGTQVHDHEARIRLLERDSADIKKTLEVLSDTISELSNGLDERLNHLGVKFDTALLKHTNEESKNQTYIMLYLISILVTILGSVAYLFLQSLMKIT